MSGSSGCTLTQPTGVVASQPQGAVSSAGSAFGPFSAGLSQSAVAK